MTDGDQQWVLGTEAEVVDYDPNKAADRRPDKSREQPAIFTGPHRDDFIKRIVGTMFGEDMVHIYNFTQHDVIVTAVPCTEQAQLTEGSATGSAKFSNPPAAEISGSVTGKWIYRAHEATTVPLPAATKLGDFTKASFQLQEHVSQAYITITEKDHPDHYWVKNAVLPVRNWGCIYGHPVVIAA